jgi:hypothetical protein
VFNAYLTPRVSHLTFWHDVPEANPQFRPGELGEYYMPFFTKADYLGERDNIGIPLLNYQGQVGLQYNPIAVAQFGLGNYNLWRRNAQPKRKALFVAVADWLVNNLELNPAGQWVWNHHFDWEYRTPLKAPWYSALAQGQGLSLLVRAHAATGKSEYLDAAQRAFESFNRPVAEGGVTFIDDRGFSWFEETIVTPPTHILNGFIWASWGVYDYYMHTREPVAGRLFGEATRTLKANLPSFDTGFWSLYEHAGTLLPMLASPFYHRLHVVQLKVMFNLTGEDIFQQFAERWTRYAQSSLKRTRAVAQKCIFKLLYY